MSTLPLHHLEWPGTGRPIVFLHGGSAHAHWWDFVAPGFADAWRPFALDLRGHGDSPWSAGEDYSLDDYARDVEAWIDARSFEHPILVGHSLGAFVALRFATDRPDRLGALVLVDGRATFGGSGSRYMRLLRMFPPAEHETLENAVAAFRLLPKETSASRAVLEHVARASYRRSERGPWVVKFDLATFDGHRPFDLRAEVATLRPPVLFVRGEHSSMLSRTAAADLAARCRKGRWVEVAGAHHHVLLDRPEALTSVIRTFLREEGLG